MILVVGDVMLDTYAEGVVRRISPEAPVPVLQITGETHHLGGAANVANNIVKLGSLCTLIGVAGSDHAHDRIKSELEEQKVPSMIFSSASRGTTVKKRYEAHGQQILRVDDECTDPIPEAVETWIAERIMSLLDQTQVIVISDYGKGVVTADLSQWIIRECFDRHIRVIVDPKGRDYTKYTGADLIKPNAGELNLATGMPTDTADQCLEAAVILSDRFNIPNVLVTRGQHGMALYTTSGTRLEASRVRGVANPVGAGDTAAAALAVALSEDASVTEAMRFANAAAGIVVEKHGTSWVTRQEVEDAIIGA